MIDLGSPDVWPSTREMAANWETQKYVRDGLLTLWDAANLMDPEGYGGIFETCSKAVQKRITGLYVTLRQSLTGNLPGFLGYAPMAYRVTAETPLGVEELPLFPGWVFLKWFEERKLEGMDGRFFERYRQPCQGLPPNVSSRKNPFWGDEEPERNNPYCWRLSRQDGLTVEQFADFYCGCSGFDEFIDEELDKTSHLISAVDDYICVPEGVRTRYDQKIFRKQSSGILFEHKSLNVASKAPELEFPRDAYIAFLQTVGLDLPREWAHIEPQTIEEPSPFHDEEAAAVEPVSAKEVAGVNACEEDGRMASDDVEILDGLTLADFKRYLESNPPLKYALPIVVKTFLLPDGHPARTQGTLRMDLNGSALKGWGTRKGGGMADSQARAIEQILLPQGKAGAGNKKTLRVLPKKEK